MAISNLANYKIVRITNRWQPQATCAAGSTSILLLPPPFSLSDYIECIGAKKHLVLGSLSHTGSGPPLGSFTIR
jgi:hypothetical protein